MSNTKVRLDVTKINSREDIDQLERQLKELDSVQIHQLGLNEVHLSYDSTSVSNEDLERAVQEAGGHLERIHPEG